MQKWNIDKTVMCKLFYIQRGVRCALHEMQVGVNNARAKLFIAWNGINIKADTMRHHFVFYLALFPLFNG